MFTFHTQQEKDDLLQKLRAADSNYDPDVVMLRRPFSSPGYHTTLTGGTVHSTNVNLAYALALLDSGEPEYIQRGREITMKVISLQDTDESHNTYGIWSWFYEEPLEKMSPPDWNWADFCGKSLIQMLRDHREHFTEQEYNAIKASVRHACYSIKKMDVSPSYTNINFMGIYVTYVAGEVLGYDDILAYAKARLRKSHAYNMKNNNFTEFNSPTYTLLAAEDLGKLYRHITNMEDKALVYDLLRICWRTILTHLHYPTRQWAGPHRRYYAETLTPAIQVKLQRALKGAITFLPEEEAKKNIDFTFFRNDLNCPEEFLKEFLSKEGERFLLERFNGSQSNPADAEIAATYLNDTFAFGSCYRNTTWNQCRNLIAYFGKDPLCFRVKFLHDFYDYCSGHLVTAQHNGNAAAILSFTTDGGDTHPNLDMVKNGTIEVMDLRLRFTVVGDTNQLTDCTAINDNVFHFDCGKKLHCTVSVPYAVFGEHEVTYDVSGEENAIHYDVILYHGKRHAIDFRKLNTAAVGFTIQFLDGKHPEKLESAVASLHDGFLTLECGTQKHLKITAPVKPAAFRELREQSVGTIDGCDINELA
jgi:hypothetical protein